MLSVPVVEPFSFFAHTCVFWLSTSKIAFLATIVLTCSTCTWNTAEIYLYSFRILCVSCVYPECILHVS